MEKIIIIKDSYTKIELKSKGCYLIKFKDINPDIKKYINDDLVIQHHIYDTIENVVIGLNRYVGYVDWIKDNEVCIKTTLSPKFYANEDHKELRSDKIAYLLQNN